MNMLQSLGTALKTPELRRKILITLALLFVYRAMASVIVPGVSTTKLSQLFQNNSVLGLLNLFSGAGVSTGSSNSVLSIVGTGLNPYINATIIMQLMTGVFPTLERMQQEGVKGRQRFNQLIRWITVPLAAVQATGYVILLSSSSVGALTNPGPGDFIRIIITFTASTVVLMWLGELITEYGVGQGVSLIIFTGIVSQLPVAILGFTNGSTGDVATLIVLAVIAVIATGIIVEFNQAQRKIPIQSSTRITSMSSRGGQGTAGGQRNILPLKVNYAGVIPIIFAISIMFMPTIAANFLQNAAGWVGTTATWVRVNWQPNGGTLSADIVYNGLYFVLVFAFTYMYTSVIFKPAQIADNLKSQSTFIPGIRPGKTTEIYLARVMARITFAGAIFLAMITVVLPLITSALTGTSTTYLGGTAILIVVSVALDTMRQIDSQLNMRQQKGFIR